MTRLIAKYGLEQAESVSPRIALECCKEFWEWCNGPQGHPEHYPEEEVVRFAMKVRKDAKAKGKTARVLDLGCGSGKHTVFLAELGFNVSAADWSKGGLSYIQSLLTKKTLSAELSVVDFSESPLPYANDSFDAIVAMQLFDHLLAPDAEKAFLEARRVLKPGGWMLCSIMSTRTSKTTRVGIPLEGEERTELVSSGNSAGEIHRFLTPEEMKLFLSRGFTIENWSMISASDQLSNEVAEAGYFILRKN